MAEFRLRPAARADIEAIWADILAAWSEEQADAYVEGLFSAFVSLAEFPLAGKAIDDVRPGYRSKPCGSHVIFYRVQSYGVEIVRLLHAHMLAELHL